MDGILVCHTEFGFTCDRKVIFDKKAVDGVEKASHNLIEIADRYGARVTFAVCPEVARHFPHNIEHEIGLHIHPGWQEFQAYGFRFYVGDAYLRQHCRQSIDSTALRDYPYEEQLAMITVGKEYLKEELGVEPRVFVAGRWSENNDTIKALLRAGFTHDCTPIPRSKAAHYDWSRLFRICMPYHPGEGDYQERGDLPLLLVPISRMLAAGSVNPEAAPAWGLPWLKACFTEYYRSGRPLFHICLHSPCMLDDYCISAMEQLIGFISRHSQVSFRFASEATEGDSGKYNTSIFPYLFRLNRQSGGMLAKAALAKIWRWVK